MSTLAAARADNFYFPPEWEPKRGGLNKFNNSHGALGKRANKLHLGILVIRFELMYNAWCLGCKRAIGRGTRYNAEKKKVGMYFSTPIYEFGMKCATCPQRFVIRTDPKNRDYEFVSGIRRKVEGYNAETAKDANAVALEDESTVAARAANALATVEHQEDNKRRAESAGAVLQATMELSQKREAVGERLNKALRRTARRKRHETKQLRRESARRGFGIRLLARSTDDTLSAALQRPALAAARASAQARRQRAVVRAQGVFAVAASNSGSGSGSGTRASRRSIRDRQYPRPRLCARGTTSALVTAPSSMSASASASALASASSPATAASAAASSTAASTASRSRSRTRLVAAAAAAAATAAHTTATHRVAALAALARRQRQRQGHGEKRKKKKRLRGGPVVVVARRKRRRQTEK